MPYATQAVSKYEFFYQEIYQDRLSPKYKAGIPFEEKIRFQMVKMSLPITWRKTRENRPALEDHKGNWECKIGKNNAVWRTIRWKVGADGKPELHPEQRGNVNLGYNTYLVDMEFPPGGSLLDGRLKRSVEIAFLRSAVVNNRRQSDGKPGSGKREIRFRFHQTS